MGSSKGLLFLLTSIYVTLIRREEALLLRNNKSILLVSSYKAGKYENVTPLCKRIIGFRVYPKTLIGLKYDSKLTKMDLDTGPNHVAGGAAFISISCEVPIRVGGCTPLYNRGTRWKAVGQRQSRKGRAQKSVRNRSTLIEQFVYASNKRSETRKPYTLHLKFLTVPRLREY
ncbi:hypothetical protein PUN28_015922 [Cardiocondyla obscurior]|uniref:Uncharacterized protein n=1 Tax=Cardiocondyla obscurior TaxID=286306 RepID=A0AAW2EUY6_9HYME